MCGVVLKINEMLNEFNRSERMVAEYILSNLDKIVGLTISELAQRSKTSKATVIRFCRLVGSKGYRDFTIKLAAETAISKNGSSKTDYIDISVGDDIELILRNVCLNNKKAIDDSYLISDMESIKKAVDAIIRAKKLNFYGVGASNIVAMDACHKFLRINKNSIAHPDAHIQLTAASNLDNEDVAVAISWSGTTNEIIQCVKLAKDNGATVISITKYGRNPVADLSDIKLMLVSPETTIRCGAMSSRIAQLNMIDILYSCIVSKEYHNVKQYLDRTSKNIKAVK